MIDLRLGDCLEVLKTLPDNSVDSVVCDPPAGISFMNLEFDHDKGGRDHWVAWATEILLECKRVMKPGAIGFIWSLPRTQHWTGWACEDAGFEIWDNVGVAHVQGGGLPKGQRIDKLIDKRLGADGDHAVDKWDGWRTKALKPAMEFWVCVQKPMSGSCVDNVLEWGVGGVNIDACRVRITAGESPRPRNLTPKITRAVYSFGGLSFWEAHHSGRYPANFILQHSPNCTDEGCTDECPCEVLGGQSGVQNRVDMRTKRLTSNNRKVYQSIKRSSSPQSRYFGGTFAQDLGGTVARYFHKFDPPFKYQSKASQNDRNQGVNALLWRRDKDSPVGWSPIDLAEYKALPDHDRCRGNIHPTVKSTGLMEFFVKLATPSGGVCLDPFMGSGTTGVACVKNGFSFIGIEREQHYMAIAQNRINYAQSNTLEDRVTWLETQVDATSDQQTSRDTQLKRTNRNRSENPGQLSLFEMDF